MGWFVVGVVGAWIVVVIVAAVLEHVLRRPGLSHLVGLVATAVFGGLLVLGLVIQIVGPTVESLGLVAMGLVVVLVVAARSVGRRLGTWVAGHPRGVALTGAIGILVAGGVWLLMGQD